MGIPSDYVERVYAGVLGKIIGVYLGRPFEGWSYEAIMSGLGEINYYVHEKRNVPLIVTDDDISGTFTFIRALEDYGNKREITAEQIGQTWLNYLIENRTVLWWGGLGNSTEHTAYLRLKQGIPAPRSGSAELNSKVVAEQIGAQIFIDGWAMVAPGDPGLATELARKAASVSHDGEAIHGAQVVAAIESMAFVEKDTNTLIETAVRFIPKDCVIHRMIGDLRNWRERESDWRKARELLAKDYGYDKYGGNCHMVPNHGLIILALLWGEDDFQTTLRIVNTSGWDTDCNSGNVGCIMGIKNGLEGIESGPDWRGPVADRMYLPTADGGRSVTDAVTEAYRIANMGLALAGERPATPKEGARYHFSLAGSVQGFVAEESVESKGVAQVGNVEKSAGERALGVSYRHLAEGRFARVATATFVGPEAAKMGGYSVLASPTLYSGQTVRAAVRDGGKSVAAKCALYVRVYGEKDELVRMYGPTVALRPGKSEALEWKIPATDGAPIAEIGVEVSSKGRADGMVYLDYLTWGGVPEVVLKRPEKGGTAWQKAWVDGCDAVWYGQGEETYRLMKNQGRGLLSHGTREWVDYRVSARIRPHMVKSAGLAARVQGMRRFYALLLCNEGTARLLKALDGEKTLGQCDFRWGFTKAYELAMEVEGGRIRGWIDEKLMFDVTDTDRPLNGGGIAVVCEEGRTGSGPVTVGAAG